MTTTTKISLGIATILTLGIAYVVYHKVVNNKNVLPNFIKNAVNSVISSGSSGSGNIGTGQYLTPFWQTQNLPTGCINDKNCQSFMQDIFEQHLNSNGTVKYIYDNSGNIWYLSGFDDMTKKLKRQLVPINFTVNANELYSFKITDAQLKYFTKYCDGAIVTDFWGVKHLDFNSNGCVTKIKPTVVTDPSHLNTPISTSGGSIASETQCAMQCAGIADSQQYIACMQKCNGTANIAIYKHGIGQYLRQNNFWKW